MTRVYLNLAYFENVLCEIFLVFMHILRNIESSVTRGKVLLFL